MGLHRYGKSEQSRWPDIPQNPYGLAALQHIWPQPLENASETCKSSQMTTYRAPADADATALAELGETSFVEAFGHLYSRENLNLFLSRSYAVENVAADIASPNQLYLIAENEGGMIGYCKLGLDITLDYDPGTRRAMELKQLYLRQNSVGTGVGQHLMDWAIAEGRTRGFDDIILSVYRDNARAQRFYQKYGFRHIADTYFMVGNHRDDEYLYGLALTA
jgi:diamine N-acetyltransferase